MSTEVKERPEVARNGDSGIGNVQTLVEYLFTSTETVGLLGTGAQDGHPDFHTAPYL